jgi:hypothetical protein
MTILNGLLYFAAGILLNMSLAHLVNFAETGRHPLIARTGYPKLASTLWGLVYLGLGGLILLLLGYQFTLQPATLLIFLGFSVWAVFLAATAERLDRRGRAR